MNSLANMPDKQVLALLLQEKARRERIKTDHLLRTRGSDAVVNNLRSLVLDRSHVFSDLCFKRARFKVLWGGRGSGKSWAVAEALIRIAVKRKVTILCVREYQNSIKDSSHRVLKNTIYRLGLQAFFQITNEEIRSRTGAFFIFKGLHGNDESIKSTEGVDICWVEEAQSVSDASWRTLIPTVRQAGSEIWVTYNLLDEESPTHQRFVINPRSNSIVHKVNFDSNPFFWDSPLAQDMEDDKRDNYHLFEHIWLGMPLVIDDSIIFSGKYVVEEFPDDLWLQADRLHFGADFGFASDPSTLIRDFVLNDNLYIEYEAYGHHIELDEMGDFYARVPGSKDWPIKADCARPETISHIRRNWGYNISAAEKWPGCVEDGIAHVRKFKKIIIHPRCTHTALEARLYRYKVDRLTKEVLPVVVDKNNHCWDGVRYSLDGHIQRSGELGIWDRLAREGVSLPD